MPQRKSGRPTNPVSRRLQLIRFVISGDNQTAFATKIGESVKRWNNYEVGKPLPRDMAIKLVKKVPGLTLDYIYLGNVAGMTVALVAAIEQAEAAMQTGEAGS